jgi:hypothetical protein
MTMYDMMSTRASYLYILSLSSRVALGDVINIYTYLCAYMYLGLYILFSLYTACVL